MTKLYRFEVETVWVHPIHNFPKRREMVYDFTTDTLIPDEQTFPGERDFYNPKNSPHIYADWDKAELAYTNLDWKLEDWEPLDWMQGSDERIETFRLISVDRYGREEIVAENNLLADLTAIQNQQAA